MKLLKVALLLAAASIASYAGTISGCGTCQGGVYSLTYSTVSTNVSGMDTYNLFLSINDSGLNIAGYSLSQIYIGAVAPKITATNPAGETQTLIIGPGGAANWTTVQGGISAGGCSANGGGFICSTPTTVPGLAAASNGTNSWQWQISLPTGTALLLGNVGAANSASLKVQYTDGSGNKIGALVSESINLTSTTATPEPSTYAMMALGLGGLGLAGRLRRSRNS